MSKNTLFAFMLIIATVAFFTSPLYKKFYYKDILKQPLPSENKKTEQLNDHVPYEKKDTPTTDTIQTLRDDIKEKDDIPEKTDTTLTTGTFDTVWVETEKIKVGISEKGARIVTLKMKEYPLEHNNVKDTVDVKTNPEYVELIPRESTGGACLKVNNKKYDNVLFRHNSNATEKEKIYVLKKSDTAGISFTTEDAKGNQLEKKFVFYGDGYVIGLSVHNRMLNNSRLALSWPSGIVESEKKTGMYQTEERAVHFSGDREVEHIRSNKPMIEEKSGFYRWIGISSKYFFKAIVLDTTRDADLKIMAFEENKTSHKEGKKNKAKKVNYSLSITYSVQGNEARCWFYTGPAEFLFLKKFSLNFHKILFPVYPWNILGVVITPIWADAWFPPIAEFVLWLLLVLFGFTRDYGVSILLLTILTRLITFPLTQSSIKSMSRMKDLQPKINTLRQKYKSNPSKMNQEIMALYKKEGVNPLNPGCLPMLLQMPVFFALFIVLRKAIELRGASTVLVPWIHDLSQPESLISFEKILPSGIPLYGSSFALLPVIMAVLTYFQNKMTIKDPNQKMLIYFMPLFMMVLFNNFPSGLVLYWTSSSALGLLQQYYTEKKRKNTRKEYRVTPDSKKIRAQ